MKRCPQCEFIYEDEQTICDMDGTTLAIDATGNAGNASPEKLSRRSTIKSVGIPALIGTVLAAFLFLAFYASPLLLAHPSARSQSSEPQQPLVGPSPEASPIQPADEPAAEPSPDAAVNEDSSEQPATAVAKNQTRPIQNHTPAANESLSIRRGVPPLPRLRPLPRLAPARVANRSTPASERRAQPEPRKDSKVSSLLKKTGRILKKPFRL